jgi:hypothetical protein
MAKNGSQPTFSKNPTSKKELNKDSSYRNSNNGSPMIPIGDPGSKSFGTAFVASVEVLPNLRDIIERNNETFGNASDDDGIHHG